MMQKVADVVRPHHRVSLISKLRNPQELEEVKDELDFQIIELTHKLTDITHAKCEILRQLIENYEENHPRLESLFALPGSEN